MAPKLVEARSPFVKMGDADDEDQLVQGFYQIEGGAWRWTSSKFSVVLAKPQGKTARLELKFSLPQAVVDQQGPLTLSAQINGSKLPAETYSKAGDYTYSAPAPSLKGTNTVEFSTDKAIAPTAQDKRELALIVVSVSLIDTGPN